MNEKSYSKADFSRFNNKMDILKRASNAVIPATLDWASDLLFKEVVKKVSGPHYTPPERISGIGKMPVPIVSGLLNKSIQLKRINPKLRILLSSNEMAPHNREVHYGTESKEARPFMEQAYFENKERIFVYWSMKTHQIISELNDAASKYI